MHPAREPKSDLNTQIHNKKKSVLQALHSLYICKTHFISSDQDRMLIKGKPGPGKNGSKQSTRIISKYSDLIQIPGSNQNYRIHNSSLIPESDPNTRTNNKKKNESN